MRRKLGLAVLISLGLVTVASAQAPAPSGAPPPAALGTRATAGRLSGLELEVAVQGPASELTPLQVACVFEYAPGDLTRPPALPAALNGMVHLDRALGGLVSELRKSGQFEGRELETLLITPPPELIHAQRVLLVGLGGRANFTPDVMTRVGRVGMREALRLGVASYAHASDLKDAGIDSATALIAQNVLRGALTALHTEEFLQQRGMAPRATVRKLTLLAGPKFFADTLTAARALLMASAPLPDSAAR